MPKRHRSTSRPRPYSPGDEVTMKRLGPKTRIRLAINRVRAEITGNYSRGNKYARGLASEGYTGGYYDALCDIELLLNGNVPNRRGYWEVPEDKKHA